MFAAAAIRKKVHRRRPSDSAVGVVHSGQSASSCEEGCQQDSTPSNSLTMMSSLATSFRRFHCSNVSAMPTRVGQRLTSLPFWYQRRMSMKGIVSDTEMYQSSPRWTLNWVGFNVVARSTAESTSSIHSTRHIQRRAVSKARFPRFSRSAIVTSFSTSMLRNLVSPSHSVNFDLTGVCVTILSISLL